MIAFGGPGRPASAAAHPYAVHPSSHNDLTPLRGYRGLIGFALLSMPPRKDFLKSMQDALYHFHGDPETLRGRCAPNSAGGVSPSYPKKSNLSK